MTDVFDSKLMAIEIRGTTVVYAFRERRDARYEIRGVSTMDLAQLRRTNGHPRWSSSATVQLLSQRYAASHYHADGRPAKPCNTPKAKLLPLTPYG